MKWTEVTLRTTQEASDAISEMLTSIGAGGVAIEDPMDILNAIAKPDSVDFADESFLAGLGDDVVIRAYFSEEWNRPELETLLREKLAFISQFLNVGEGIEGFGEVDEEDWSTAWKKYYKPLEIGSRLVIKPTWEIYDNKEDRIIIEMDPGMAFGTGTHETTRLCAAFLEKYVKPGDQVLDLGCGTGILAITAVRLGAEKALAVDIDEVAVRVSRENIQLNSVTAQVTTQKGILDDVAIFRYNIVVANIIAAVIAGIAPQIPEYLVPGGLFVTSGIIRERADEVREAYQAQGFTELETEELGEWVAMVFRCPDSL